MTESNRISIGLLPTGVPGLDSVLGGGLPEYSFNLLAGTAGTGKTTLVHQILFANASAERPALYFTVLGEPALKILRYQQKFRFFDQKKLPYIRFVNLTQEALDQDLEAVYNRIVREVEALPPRFLVVDSFRSILRRAADSSHENLEVEGFVQRLAVHLTTWQTTSILVGEYPEGEMRDNPVFTVADGILRLYQSVDGNSMVRQLQVVKMRGQATQPGLHTFRITGSGIQIFPRSFGLDKKAPRPRPLPRTSIGVTGLDEMMGGGIPVGDLALVAGPAGSGKTLLASQFIAEGLRRGEPGVVVVFEEQPEEYLARGNDFGLNLVAEARDGKLKVLSLRPLDLSVDEMLWEVRDAVEQLGAKRVVIDSLSGFELALAPAFRQDFREALYRMLSALTGIGVTVLNTVDMPMSEQAQRFSSHALSFLTDDLILQRFIEVEGEVRKVLTVMKMRSGSHSKDVRSYEITAEGLVVGERVEDVSEIPVSPSPPSGRAPTST